MTAPLLPLNIAELRTPAALVDAGILAANLTLMAKAWPGERLRPHVKAHKCTELARHQRAAGHTGFTCATIREVEGMATARLGEDLLLANEVLSASRLAAVAARGARVTMALDSPATVHAAREAGMREVLIDVNVGLPRCGCAPDEAGSLAELARGAGLEVRGVMGYEGHAMLLPDRADRARKVADSMVLLEQVHAVVGGPVRSAGGTGSWDLNTSATELEAGSYALMDTAYAAIGVPFGQALSILATVISVNQSGGWAVADCGLKALGMDHGLPSLADGSPVWRMSDEHLVFRPAEGAALPTVGAKVRVLPAHIDPTVAYHERLFLVEDDRVLEAWPVDLRGW
jgi:D-serine deaminase-like pyridoxal phosphate-dependent protein